MNARTTNPPVPDGVNRRFLKLWIASGCSNLGDGVWLIAAPLLASTLTRDPSLIAGIAFAQRLPWLLFGLIGGAMSDRLDRRRTMIIVSIVRATLVGVLGVSIVLDRTTLPLLYAVMFTIALGETLFDTSASALLPTIVPEGELPRANARLMGTFTVTNQFVGPPLGGVLYGLSASLPFLLGAAGLSATAGMLASLRGSFRATTSGNSTERNLRREIGEGIGWLWRHRLLRTISISMGLLNLTLVAQVSITVLVAEERLGLSAAGYGLLVTAYGVGGVLGSLLATRVLGRISESGYLRLAIAIEAIVPALIALSTNAYSVGAIFIFFGMHAVVWGTLLTSLRQALTPDHLRGRVGGAFAVLEYGTAAPGALLGGLLATQIGLTAPFWLGAIVGALLLPWVWSAFSAGEIAAARATANGLALDIKS